jgi:hypothetical protein
MREKHSRADLAEMCRSPPDPMEHRRGSESDTELTCGAWLTALVMPGLRMSR